MEIVVQKAQQYDDLDGRTCNSGSNNSGNQGSMCRADEFPTATVTLEPVPPLSD
jgi:hypothetical protein